MRSASFAAALACVCLVGGCRSPWTASVRVPQAAGQMSPDAVAALAKAGLQPRFRAVPAITSADTGINGYYVNDQDPAPGVEVDPGSTVILTLILSANGGDFPPAPVASVVVPDVIGLDVTTALGRLTQLGLLVDVPATGERSSVTVVSQSPAPGTRSAQGRHVRLDI